MLYLSPATHDFLKEESMLDGVLEALSGQPAWVPGGAKGKFIWGRSGHGESVLLYSGTHSTFTGGEAWFTPVEYELYLPKGVFGVSRDKGSPSPHAKKAWMEMKNLIRFASGSLSGVLTSRVA
ncbi:hypothetical protein CSUI_004967 [Cystoisospora suis]|uniref:Uncharacterized protein n=1 Tax=Cystoisospora suis TaxID=483139 RepID=A0A2C6KL19_9APIC|nr:hypothetical protein CSUI_004967 [Cystoisospora suis]